MPGRGAVRIRSRPSCAIARFSPRIGTMSETVPIVARSASSSASASASASSRKTSRATANATPDPDSRRSGYAASSRCGLTRATAAGRTSGRWWWSVMITSIPRPAAAAISATLVDPVSTVTTSVTPSRDAVSTAAIDRPCPSSRRLGTYGTVSRPRRRKASTSWARPVRPSASKSPKTITRSRRSTASRMRATRRSASGSSRGSCRPSAAGPRNRAIAAGSAMPRRARTVAANVPRPSSRAAARTSGARWRGSGNTQR